MKLTGRKNAENRHRAVFARAGSIGLLLALCVAASAKTNQGDNNHYQQVNLVSDEPGVALLQDSKLVNAWGISFSATGPFWISDNGTGLSTLYAVTNDSSGQVHVTKQALEVAIPGEGNLTGQVFDGSGSFHGDIFIFVSEDGTISGWKPPLGTAAEVLASRSTAVYKGVTLVHTPNGPLLLAANFAESTVDVYRPDGATATLVDQLSDGDAPEGYAPFNVQNIAGYVFVTFAKQDDARHDDVPGKGHGLIDILNPVTGAFTRFATGLDAGGTLEAIDSPWGIALAPNSFGKHGDQLLVGNFGAGTIMTFDASGKFHSLLKRTSGGPLVIDGLWGLAFGNGARAGNADTLYFTAGPGGESHGLFGSISPMRERDLHSK